MAIVLRTYLPANFPFPRKASAVELQQVPFCVADAKGLSVTIEGRQKSLWCVDVDGLIGLQANSLRLQFQIEDRFEPYSELRDLRVPLRQVDALELKRRWFKPMVLTLRTRDVSLLEGAPGARGGVLRLQVQRKYRLELEELISTTALDTATLALSSAERTQIPPGPGSLGG